MIERPSCLCIVTWYSLFVKFFSPFKTGTDSKQRDLLSIYLRC